MLRSAIWTIGPLLILLSVVSGNTQGPAQGSQRTWPARPIVPVLDPQDGIRLVWNIDREDLRRTIVDELREDVRWVLREKRVPIQGAIEVLDNGVQLRIPDATKRAEVIPVLRALSQPIVHGGAGRTLDVYEGAGGLVRLLVTDAGLADRMRASADRSVEVIRRRLDGLGIAEPTVRREGDGRIVVEVRGAPHGRTLVEVVGTAAKLQFRMEADPDDPDDEVESLLQVDDDGSVSRIRVHKRVVVSGEDLTDARAGIDRLSNEPVLNFSFDERGRRKFAEATSRSIGKRMAIVLDGKVISAPKIMSAIIGGAGQISGRFTAAQTARLSLLLRTGALPARLVLAEERRLPAPRGK